MKTDYVYKNELLHVLAALTPANRLVCEISLVTGLRVGDVLKLRTEALRGILESKSKQKRLTVVEQKTGKSRRVYFPTELLERVIAQAGPEWAFNGRLDDKHHRTRQAVYKDLKRASRLFRIKLNISPHSCRKIYAVNLYRRTGDLEKVRETLQHSQEAITMLYAMADVLTARKLGISVEQLDEKFRG
uniref:Tyr recombinase domain-containing protein n=1 Tax=uncultured prokaryote TaxID=198431 RepID=A0A0H5QIV9_9ZZZZ|nr:hypothetical protein [uncultured prokaryote]